MMAHNAAASVGQFVLFLSYPVDSGEDCGASNGLQWCALSGTTVAAFRRRRWATASMESLARPAENFNQRKKHGTEKRARRCAGQPQRGDIAERSRRGPGTGSAAAERHPQKGLVGCAD